MIPLKMITKPAVSACQRSSVQLPCTMPAFPGMFDAPPTPMYSMMWGSANTPTIKPPVRPAIPCV